MPRQISLTPGTSGFTAPPNTNSPATGVTTAGATITADELISLVYSLKRPYRKNAAFIINDQTLSVIRKLKDANQAYIWQPSYQAGEPDRLLGYALHTSPYMPTAEVDKVTYRVVIRY